MSKLAITLILSSFSFTVFAQTTNPASAGGMVSGANSGQSLAQDREMADTQENEMRGQMADYNRNFPAGTPIGGMAGGGMAGGYPAGGYPSVGIGYGSPGGIPVGGLPGYPSGGIGFGYPAAMMGPFGPNPYAKPKSNESDPSTANDAFWDEASGLRQCELSHDETEVSCPNGKVYRLVNSTNNLERTLPAKDTTPNGNAPARTSPGAQRN